MSTASNFFAALSDDRESKTVPSKTPVDKKTTSSKKTDTPPAKADPARANPNNRKRYEGNEAAIRDKSRGKQANRDVPVPESASQNTHRNHRAKQDDRRSRSGHHDTSRRVKSGWGDNRKELEDEKVGDEIAAKEKSADQADQADQADATPAPKTLTLAEYLAQQAADNADLDVSRGKPAPESADKEEKFFEREQQVEFVTRKSGNKKRTNRKEVEQLEPGLDEIRSHRARQQREERQSTRSRDSRESRGGRGGRERSDRGRSDRSERSERPSRGPREPRERRERSSEATAAQ